MRQHQLLGTSVCGMFIRLWDVHSKSLVAKLKGRYFSDFVFSVSPDGSKLATAIHRHEVQIYDLTNLKAGAKVISLNHSKNRKIDVDFINAAIHHVLFQFLGVCCNNSGNGLLVYQYDVCHLVDLVERKVTWSSSSGPFWKCPVFTADDAYIFIMGAKTQCGHRDSSKYLTLEQEQPCLVAC